VVCYFSNWAGLRPGDGKFLPEHLDSSLCSHVVYAFARLDEERLVPAPSGPKADLDAGYYRRLLETAGRTNPSAKVLLALGGWADSAGDKYSRLVGSPAARANFVTATVAFLRQYGFQVSAVPVPSPASDCGV
jgi:chitinase